MLTMNNIALPVPHLAAGCGSTHRWSDDTVPMYPWRMRSLVVAGVLVLAVPRAADADEPTVSAIVKDMTAAYSAATSYEDSGTITETFIGRTFPPKVEQFRTALERGRRFRLEVRIGNEHVTPYVIWSDFQHTLVAQGNDIADAHRPLGETLGEASQLTSGFTSSVPPMLLPGEAGARARSLANLVLVGAEKVDGHPCWHLAHGELALWVDKESHLLRKRTERDGNHLVTTVYEPAIDAPIQPAHLSRPMVEPTPEPALTYEERLGRSAERAKAIIGTQALSFVAERVSGRYPVALDKLRGHVVVLEFFGTWCPPCGPAADELRKVDQAHAKVGVRTIALSAESTTTISQFGKEHGVGFTLGRDNLGEIQRAYGLEAVPSVVIIDGDGIVRDVQIGFAPGQIEAAITKTLREGERPAQ